MPRTSSSTLLAVRSTTVNPLKDTVTASLLIAREGWCDLTASKATFAKLVEALAPALGLRIQPMRTPRLKFSRRENLVSPPRGPLVRNRVFSSHENK